MTLRRLFLHAALLSVSISVVAGGNAQQSAITSDPTPDKANPAAMESFQIPSHGALLNALAYIAEGPGPHPVVVLLHGFPGNEKNLDLAQAIRRAGWDVLYFNYRGSWGSPGDFSLTHSIEDTQAVVAYLRDPADAKKLRSDPANIVLIGHSMGGFIARYVGAEDPAIKSVGLISASDMGVGAVLSLKSEQRQSAVPLIAAGLAAEGMAPLAGCTPVGMAQEIVANAALWDVPKLAPRLMTRPVLVITSEDGNGASNNAFVAALHNSGSSTVTAVHIATDHAYSDHRIALQRSILEFLDSLHLY